MMNKAGTGATVAKIAAAPFDKIVAASDRERREACARIRKDLQARFGLSDRSLMDDAARMPHEFALEEMTQRAHALGNEALALESQAAWRLGEHGVGDYLNSSCATLGEYLNTITDFVPLLHDGLALEVHEQGRETLLTCRFKPGVRPHRHMIEAVLAKIIVEVRHALGDNVHASRAPIAAHFAHAPPGYERRYGELLQTTTEFRQGHDALVFDTEALAAPFSTADKVLHALLLEYATDELRGSGAQGQLVDYVRSVAEHELLRNGASQTEVARRCGMSVATLRRRLERTGIRYRDLLNDLQREVSARELVKPHAEIDQVCREAGFSHKAAFYRAFKRWYGCTPAEYRRTRGRGQHLTR